MSIAVQPSGVGAGENFLVITDLSKHYGTLTAVDRISFGVRRGSFVSLLGPSGCGKSTTLQMIAGFTEPSGGQVELDGHNMSGISPGKRDLGIVFQSYALFPHMTIEQNVAFGLEMRKVPAEERKQRVADILDLVGLSHRAGHHPAALSGGQQQRVALARALVIKPRLLLLDEPLSNLDAKLREEMRLELKSIQRSVGVTTLLVTHDQDEALGMSDEIILMRNGRIEQRGEPTAAYDRPSSAFTADFMGSANVIDARLAAQGCIEGTATVDTAGAAAYVIRPERVVFAETGADAVVVSSTFLGSRWLFQVKVNDAAVSLLLPNDGRVYPEAGQHTKIGWRAIDLRRLETP